MRASARRSAFIVAAGLLAGCAVVAPDEPAGPQAAAGSPGVVPSAPADPEAAERERARQPKTRPADKLPPPPSEPPTRQAEAKDIELPLYPGAQLLRNEATRAQRQSAVVYLSTPDSLRDVYGWYKKQLADRRLKVDRLQADGGAPSATLREVLPDGLREITLTREGDRTMILLVRLRAAGVLKP